MRNLVPAASDVGQHHGCLGTLPTHFRTRPWMQQGRTNAPCCASMAQTSWSFGKTERKETVEVVLDCMALRPCRHLEAVDKTIKFQASPHKVEERETATQRKKDRENDRKRQRKTDGERERQRERQRIKENRIKKKWDRQIRKTEGETHGDGDINRETETGMSQSSLLLLTFQPCSQLGYIPVGSCPFSSFPLSLCVHCYCYQLH